MKKQECKNFVEHEERAKKAQKSMLSVEEMEKVCRLFKLFSEPSRLKIVLVLLQGELCVQHIVEGAGGTQSAVSHQLRVLKDGGVVKSRRDGQNVLYSLSDEHIVSIIQTGAAHLSCK